MLAQQEAQFASAVDAVRIGTVTAFDQKAANRWAAERDKLTDGRAARSRGLSGAALERAMMQLAQAHPDLVVYGER